MRVHTGLPASVLKLSIFAIAHDEEFCGIMSEGLMPISKTDDYIRVIDEKGNEIFTLKEFKSKEVLACYAYSDSKIRVVLEDGSIVYLDKVGKMLFESRFSLGNGFPARSCCGSESKAKLGLIQLC